MTDSDSILLGDIGGTNARFAILYQNDDAGNDYLRGAREALGADADKAIAALKLLVESGFDED